MVLRKVAGDMLRFVVVTSILSLIVLAEHPCDSAIYCHGRLLKTVQLAGIYSDSKTFVDQPLRFSPAIVTQNFNTFMTKYQNKPTKPQIQNFVDTNFLPGGSELETWTPTDFTDNPKFLNNIKVPEYREFARNIHQLWKDLGRKISPDVQQNPNKHSLVYVSNPFIVPGGRSNEYSYWDSYWIQKGLLVSGMPNTVKGMIQNFLDLVNQLGYVPNGGRIYYQRSQPPLLISMFNNYYQATRDMQFLKRSLPTLKKEFDFWYHKRSIQVHVGGKAYRMFHYNSNKTEPRPESYREDYILASSLNTSEEQNELYRNIHSAAESGWDFSSRWFRSKKVASSAETLIDTKTRHIIPVDLNSLMYHNAKQLSQYELSLGNLLASEKYAVIASQLQKAINTVLWNEKLGSWFDYDLFLGKIDKNFYPATILPLWTRAAGEEAKGDKARRLRAYKYLISVDALNFPGGIPASLHHSAEQWDFPNAWPPLQYFMVEGLDGYSHLDTEIENLPLKLARIFLESIYKGYVETELMFDKYDAMEAGKYGGGGEYVVQPGFGWTNGVVLHFLNKYGDKLLAPILK